MNEQRDAVVQRLSENFAADRLSLEELERRLDLVFQASTPGELTALIADLPAGPQPGLPLLPMARQSSATQGVMPAQIRAVLGNVERSGVMDIPRELEVRAALGNIELDLRDAQFGPLTEIHIRAVLGNVEIVLPFGVRVENDGNGFLGSFVCDVAPGSMPMVGTSPVVRLTGKAVLGNVEVRSAAMPYGHDVHAALQR